MLNPYQSPAGQFLLRWLHQHPRCYAAARKLTHVRAVLPPQKVEELPGRIHRNDFMALDLPGYIRSSKEHFAALGEDFQFGGQPWHRIEELIDFGCGYGRVTRWFPTVMDPRRVTACDVTSKAVYWCAREFGIKSLLARPEIEGTAFARYDALFACSVLTHLSCRMIRVFLRTLQEILVPGGVAVVTGKGPFSAESASSIKEYLSSSDVQSALGREGFYFLAYPHYKIPDLGDTFFTADWLQNQLPPTLELVRSSTARYWTHDGYVLRRLSQ